VSPLTQRTSSRIALPFDEDVFVRAHRADVLPAVSLVILNGQGLAFAVGIDESAGHKITRGVKRAVVAQCERTVCRGVADRAPEINDLCPQAVSGGSGVTYTKREPGSDASAARALPLAGDGDARVQWRQRRSGRRARSSLADDWLARRPRPLAYGAPLQVDISHDAGSRM
jgi:hypothetical protein